MLHELLLALVGHTGSIITEVYATPAEYRSLRGRSADDVVERLRQRSGRKRGPGAVVVGFQVDRAIEFISEPDKIVIDRICMLGFYYNVIEKFIDRHKHAVFTMDSVKSPYSSAAPSNVSTPMPSARGGPRPSVQTNFSNPMTQPGLYVRALCVGLDDILDTYRSVVLKTEQEILREEGYQLTRLNHVLRDFFPIFTELHRLLDDISDGVRCLKGGEILAVLYRHSLVGIPLVQAVMKRLLHACHNVLFNQVLAWVVNGMLTDPMGEFFIEHVRSDMSSDNEGIGGGGNSLSTHPSRKPSSLSLPRRTPSVSSHRSNGSISLSSSATSAFSIHNIPWNAQFKLRLSMLPTSYIPLHIANKILFIGRAVSLLQHADVSYLADGVPLLPHADQVTFARAVHSLQQETEFDLLNVSLKLDEMRSVVTRHMWNLVVKKAKLQGASLFVVLSFFPHLSPLHLAPPLSLSLSLCLSLCIHSLPSYLSCSSLLFPLPLLSHLFSHTSSSISPYRPPESDERLFSRMSW